MIANRQVLQIPFFVFPGLLNIPGYWSTLGWMPQTLKDQTKESPGVTIYLFIHWTSDSYYDPESVTVSISLRQYQKS